MSYTVEILRRARKQMVKIASEDCERIIAAIEELGETPRPPGCKKLSGRPAWRIRVGRYRVIYEIHDDRLLVLVVAAGYLPIASQELWLYAQLPMILPEKLTGFCLSRH